MRAISAAAFDALFRHQFQMQANAGQRRAQLVGRVGGEQAFLLDGVVQPREQLIERIGDRHHFVLSLLIGSGVRLSAERFSSRCCNWLSGRVIQLMAQNDASSVTIIMISDGASSDAMASAISVSTRSLRTLADKVSSTGKLICSGFRATARRR